MGVWDLTRRLDQAVLPHLAHAITWCARGAVRRRALVGATVCASAGLLVASVWAAHEPLPRDDPASVVRVGMEQGQSAGAYAQEAGRELEQITDRAGETYALVSFGAYLASDRLAGAISEMSTYRVYARAWIPDGDADVVEITVSSRPGDVRAAMLQIADRKDEQARTYRRDASKLTGGSETERRLRRGYLADAEAAAAEAAAYRSNCSCLFAAVVRGEVAELGRLAKAAGVRAVDPAPEVTDLRRAVFLPPLPEDPDNVQPSTAPPTSASPSGAPSPSPSQLSSPSPSQSPTTQPTPSRDHSGSGSPSATRDDQTSSEDQAPDRDTGT